MSSPRNESGLSGGRWQNTVVAITAVLFALFSLFGVNQSIQALEATVDRLDDRVAELEAVENHIRDLKADVKEIAEVRNEIMAAIADAIDRPRPRSQPRR